MTPVQKNVSQNCLIFKNVQKVNVSLSIKGKTIYN